MPYRESYLTDLRCVPEMQPINRLMQHSVWLCGRQSAILPGMTAHTKIFLLSVIVLSSALLAFRPSAAAPASGPEYTSDNKLKFPEQYREWVYLSSGFDMSYGPAMDMGHHMFDNVFVDPQSYKKFVETGTWPDKTVMVLEARRAEGKGSINQNGNYQGEEVHGLEVHVKDEARFPGKWAFFGSRDGKTGELVPFSANCYSCHVDHGAVDTTFVQFYPTLMPVAKSKSTLAAGYLKEKSEPAKEPAKE